MPDNAKLPARAKGSNALFDAHEIVAGDAANAQSGVVASVPAPGVKLFAASPEPVKLCVIAAPPPTLWNDCVAERVSGVPAGSEYWFEANETVTCSVPVVVFVIVVFVSVDDDWTAPPGCSPTS